mgnify:CR=1 FL=1
MCGIYGYVGSNNAYNEVLQGLYRLQYRGYDSCGIAYFDNGFKINKVVGTLDNLPRAIDSSAQIAFGHTRWATNGEVNINNTHPHESFNNEFVVVHNGIIKNADKLKQDMMKNNIPFYSDTDTEVIVNLLASMSGRVERRLEKLYELLDGSFSLIIGQKNGDIFILKKFSPLSILKAEDGIYISSDVSSLKEGELYTLEDNDIIMIKKNQIIPLSNTTINFKPHKNTINEFTLGEYKYYMLKEINEIPKGIENTYYHLRKQDIKKIFKHFNKFTLIGCGTAYHSCLIGEYFFKRFKNYFVDSCLASNYSINKQIKRKHLHIIVSQSGETADCIKVAQDIKKHNGKIFLITNEENSTLAHIANYKILTKAGKEVAVASTKTYCSQLFVFAYITEVLKDKNYNLDISSLVADIENFIAKIDLKSIVDKLKKSDKLILIGKDMDYLLLLEASLKIREIDYIYTIPMYSGELKHGTLSLIDKNSYVLSLNTSSDKNKLDIVKNEIESREGKVIAIDEFFDFSKIDENYKPIYAIIPFQLLSYQIAIKRGYNPDMPRNLAKSVTVE